MSYERAHILGGTEGSTQKGIFHNRSHCILQSLNGAIIHFQLYWDYHCHVGLEVKRLNVRIS